MKWHLHIFVRKGKPAAVIMLKKLDPDEKKNRLWDFCVPGIKHIKANLHLSAINASSSGRLGSKIKYLYVTQL